MTTMTPPRRLDTRHLRRHAEHAIFERLQYPAPYAILAVERDGDAVIIRLNSGGNALAVEPYLRQRGYRAEYAGGNPDGYGCAVRVSLLEPAPETSDDETEDGEDDRARFRDYGRERLESALSAVLNDGTDLEVLGELELALMSLAVYYGSDTVITLNPADVTEYVDQPDPQCICPPGLTERGGFRSGCPVHHGREATGG